MPATVSDSELAFGLEFALQLPENRSLAFRTACLHSASDAELRSLLKRMTDASDYIGGMYELRALRRLVEQLERELRTQLEQKDNYRAQAEAEWYSRDRRGPFAMTEAQQAQSRNFDMTAERIRQDIEKRKKEIAELEATQK